MRRNCCKYSNCSGIYMSMRRLMAILAVVVFSLAATFIAAADTTTKVSLVLSAETARPGDTVMAGIRLQMKPQWHTYWKNAGDSGIPTEIKWTLPPGVTAGDIQWPVPEKLVTPPLTTYVYEDEATLLVPLKIAPDAAAGPLEIAAKVSWQECAEVCIQGHTDVSANVVIGTASKPSSDAAFIESAAKKLPSQEANPPITARWETDDENRPMVIEWDASSKPVEADFFPYADDKYEVKGETERLQDAGAKVRIRKLVSKSGANWPTTIPGLLISKPTKESPAQAREVSLKLSTYTPSSQDATMPPPNDASLLVMLGFAFIGGLILNIMPCVLPVIALKVLGFVNQAKESPGRVRKLGLVYGLGVLVSFLALALVEIAIKNAGGTAGWSTAFQNPQFRVIITILITLVALNLFGVFEVTLSGRAMGAAGDLTAKEGVAGAFFNGVLATVLATPCVAPFLGVAITFALTQPAASIILIFLAVGVGLATPFVALCWQPAWLKFLPRPGLWMQQFKVAMGFPMLATAVWLFWATATRLGQSGVLWFGLFLVVLALAAWIWGEFVQRGTKRTRLAVVFSLALVVSGYGFILEKQLSWRSPNGARKEAIDWQTWSAQAVEKARGEGHPVLVDFTAALCLNCKLNEKTSIDIERTRTKLKEINAVTFVADFTDEDPLIARELKRFGRTGVPLVVVYPAEKKLPPVILPPILTPGIVLDALEKAAHPPAPSASVSRR
ncbi:MAG: cytochrome c biosis protein transrane region [Pedosphaera sp.]|nr:cytochrome c biosis protein transrane region [Pedosphaera sp.]